MPTIPTVFRSIRPNDVQFRPFKAYKNYSLKSTTPAAASASGYFAYNGIFLSTPPLLGDPDNTYASNSIDNRNQQVVWKQIDHKYYRHPYDPARSAELTNRNKTVKRLSTSMSLLTVPYFQSGERLLPKSVQVVANGITLNDDGNGNLRDAAIDSSSMMNDNDLKMYMSFNEAYRVRKTPAGLTDGNLKYELRRSDAIAQLSDIKITDGPNGGSAAKFAGQSIGDSFIRIPHNDIFDRMNACDDWTLSFWVYIGDRPNATDYSIISKFAVMSEQQLDRRNSKVVTADKIISNLNANFSDVSFIKYRRPFECFVQHQTSTFAMYFRISDGTFQRTLQKTDLPENAWYHVAAINNGSTQTVSLYVNGALAESQTMPPGPTGNKADVIFGSIDLTSDRAATKQHELAEVRLYDTSASAAQLETLAHSSGVNPKMFQTNIVGNVFYRNGQIVVSSPLNKFTGSGFFNGTFDVSYKGQHTIYENEVMVRVPADSLNVSMNPSATYRPPAGETELCAEGQANRPPGELRKTIFTDGTAFPYITTIGLYNDMGQLLAVGKLAQPVQKRDDVDMNFIIRWDY